MKEYTFTFNLGQYDTYCMWIDDTIYYNGDYSPKYSFTAKLGQDISSAWPMNGGNAVIWDNDTINTYYFYGWQGSNTSYTGTFVTKQILVTTELLPTSGSSATYTGRWYHTVYEYAVNYWLQNADDDGYTVSEQYSQTYYSRNESSSLEAKEIAGYSKHNGDASAPEGYEDSSKTIIAVTPNNDGNWVRDDERTRPNATYYEYEDHLYRERVKDDKNKYTRFRVTLRDATNFYYDLDAFAIEYYYGSLKLKTIENVKYGANISSETYNWTPTTVQCNVDNDYTFVGWYDNPGCNGDPYTFDKMPAGASNGSVGLTLYAKWQAPAYTVSFVDDDGSTRLANDLTVEKYHKATAPESNPTKEGYAFDGWYTTADGDKLFDWNTQITADTTIFAHWTRNTLSYTVHYVDAEGNSLAADKVVINPNYTVGQTVTEQAIAVSGYRPDANSKDLMLAADNNEITFVYTPKSGTTSYTVRYILDPEEYPGNIAVATEDVVENVSGDVASVIKTAKPVDYDVLYGTYPNLVGLEFTPDAVEKTLVLTSNANENVLTFYYSSFKHTNVTVNFVDMAGNAIHDPDTKIMKVGSTYTLSRTPISGWELDKAVVGTSYNGDSAGSSYAITDATSAAGLTFTLFYKKKATVTVVSRSKQYDGTALTLPANLTDQVTISGLLDGDSPASVDYTYTNADAADSKGRLNAGTATVTPKDAEIAGTHAGTPNYYKIHYIAGTLTVNKINVTVRVEPDRWTGNVYNGTDKKAGFTNGSKTLNDYVIISHDGYRTEYQDDIWTAITNLDNVIYDASAAGLHYYVKAEKDAGDYTYNVGLTTAMLPVDPNYSVSLYVRPGRLQINPAPVTIATGSASKPYDGTALTKDEASITGLVNGEAATVTATGSQTAVGSSDNTYSIDWGTTKASNYAITEEFGTLEVTAATLDITVNDKTVPYNGKTQYGYGYDESGTITVTGTGDTITTDDYTITGLAIGQVLTIGYTPKSGINVGEYDEGAFGTISIESATGEDVTDAYDITADAGKLTITKAPLTITAKDQSYTYNGSAQGEDNATYTDASKVTVEGLQGSDALTGVTLNGRETNVGEYVGKIVPSAAAVGEATGNYEITYTAGKLTISPKAVTITAKDASQTYNGSALTESGFTATALEAGDAHTFTVVMTAESTITNVGTQKNVIATVDGTTVSKDAATQVGNYLVTVVDGTLTVNPKAVTITAKDANKPYDGDPLTQPEFTQCHLVSVPARLPGTLRKPGRGHCAQRSGRMSTTPTWSHPLCYDSAHAAPAGPTPASRAPSPPARPSACSRSWAGPGASFVA